ncbi:MAG: hypothetical protein KCHDKBKB_00011 [Elusimicrobia bacterium]|nr:hypothetical protein [Elusimicrobiota bacterium]
MKQEILKPKEENLFSLATEMGLVITSEETTKEKEPKNIHGPVSHQKPFSQLT